MPNIFIPSNPSAHKGNRRYTKIVGGDELINDTADMLTEPLPAFEQRMAAQYSDWAAFLAWIDAKRLTTFAAVILAVLLWLPARAQVPPPGGTIPPVTGIACLPDTANIGGCVNKVWLPLIAVTSVTGEGGSGILPVRGQP
jgi:hypothetical protein